MKINKIFILSILSLIIFSGLVQAVEIKSAKQGSQFTIYQTCNNCTYCNMTSLRNQQGNFILPNTEVPYNGTDYAMVIGGGNLTALGTYTYCYNCGNSDTIETGCIDFQVTPSGRSGNSNIALAIIVIIMIYAITLISFFGRNIPMSILSGSMMGVFGLWIVNNGIVVYRDYMTNYFGYVTAGIGFIIAFIAAFSLIRDEF